MTQVSEFRTQYLNTKHVTSLLTSPCIKEHQVQVQKLEDKSVWKSFVGIHSLTVTKVSYL